MKRIRATTTFSARSDGTRNFAGVPAKVRDKLDAKSGDTLVFEEGTMWAAERAAARGTYFIVTLERPSPAVAAQSPAEATTEAPVAESFEEAVRRKQQGG